MRHNSLREWTLVCLCQIKRKSSLHVNCSGKASQKRNYSSHGHYLCFTSKQQQEELEGKRCFRLWKNMKTRTFQSLDFQLLICFFLTVESQQEQKPNVSLVWIDGFQPHLSWEPPLNSVQPCTYTLESETSHPLKGQRHIENAPDQEKTLYTVMEGGFLQLILRSVCNGSHSEVIINTINGDLVKDLTCSVYDYKKTNCTWSPLYTPDLRFFYRLILENFTRSADSKPDRLNIKECSSYISTNGVRTGCNLEMGTSHTIDILFNGTLNKTWNTFRKISQDLKLQPPPLNWTVNKTGDKFYIRWTPPNIDTKWTVKVKYTECDKTENLTYSREETSGVLKLVPHCSYRMAIIALATGGNTPWSEEMYFGADSNNLLYAAIIIPLVFAGLAVLLCLCWTKNKENIFPKVPKPRDFLSDISDNNNKSTVQNLYIPAEEEDNCKITLVLEEPHINKVGF